MQSTLQEQASIQALRQMYEEIGFSPKDAELSAEALTYEDDQSGPKARGNENPLVATREVARLSDEVEEGRKELARLKKEGSASDPEVAAMEKKIASIMTRPLEGITKHGHDANGYPMLAGGAKGRLREKPIHRAMAICAAEGDSSKTIAEKFGYCVTTVDTIRTQPWFISLVIEIQAIRQMSVEQRLLAESQQALTNLVQLASGAKSENVKLQANVNLLDRAYGKPIQRVENFNASLTEVRDAANLDKEKAHIEEQLAQIKEQRAKIMQAYKTDGGEAGKEGDAPVEAPAEGGEGESDV